MLDSLLNGLKDEAGGALMSQLGLSGGEVDKVVASSQSAVEKTVKGDGMVDGLMNLFSDNDNDDKGNSAMESLGGNLLSSLTSNGFSSEKSSSIQAIVLPMLIKAVTSMVKGDSSNLSNLLGSAGLGDIAGDMLKDKAGGFVKGLFK